MKVLLVSAVFSMQYDCGMYFLRALSELGHHVSLWDYRLQREPPQTTYDAALVYKGSFDVPTALPGKKLLYYPDDFNRTPDIWTHGNLDLYDHIFTTVRPTPRNMIWIPTGYDPDIYRPTGSEKQWRTIFVGTRTDRKACFLEAIKPEALFGNGWTPRVPDIYLHEYVEALSRADIAINIHRDNVGVNSRLFEMMACTFTLTDIVPGVREVIGQALTEHIGFATPEEAKELVDYFLAQPREREQLWEIEKEVIKPYTYLEATRRMLEYV